MKRQLIKSITIILLVISVGYMLFDLSSEYLQGEKLLAYNQGTNDGVIYWNNQVVEMVNTESNVPFILNNTIQKIPITQLCDERE